MRIRPGPWLAVTWALGVSVITGPRASAQDPCAEDVRQFCPSVKLGDSRVADCLRANQPRLSATCRDKLDADALRARAVVMAFGRACKDDVEAFCPAVEPGGGRVLGCLAQHQLDLSPSCQSETAKYAEARDRVALTRKACTADLERLCSGVPSEVVPLLSCLEANQAKLSSECSAAGLRQAAEAASLVAAIEEASRQDRVKESLQILQGLDSVAFSRSQVLLQYDSYQGLKNQANASRLLFNPQFVFGDRREFALQLKVPILTLYPYVAGAPTQSGLGAVVTAFGWNFHSRGQLRQYLGLGVQWQTASTAPLGGPWAVVPSYAVAVSLARWVSLTTQVVWYRSVGGSTTYPELNLLLLEPILVFALPGRSFLALDARLGWDMVSGSFLPLLKGMAGIYVDRQKALSITAWYQAALSSTAETELFRYEVGLGLAYYFDW